MIRIHTLLLGLVIALTAAGLASPATARTASGDAPEHQALKVRHLPIRGTWQVTVDPAPAGGTDAFESTIAYGAAKEVVEATSRSSGTSAGIGSWKALGRSTYTMTFQKYRFDATGTYLGKTVVSERIRVTGPATYRGRAVTQVQTPDGSVVAQFESYSTGTRLAP
jgi:hypothetical protein